jgi:hypothetical protein
MANYESLSLYIGIYVHVSWESIAERKEKLNN